MLAGAEGADQPVLDEYLVTAGQRYVEEAVRIHRRMTSSPAATSTQVPRSRTA